MKNRINEVLMDCSASLTQRWTDLRESCIGVEHVGGICLLSNIDQEEATDKLAGLEESFSSQWDIISLSNFLISAKQLGYNERDMREYIDMLEEQRSQGLWSNQIWLNSLALKALGKYGISYPNMTEYLLEKRGSKGSWFEKNWVTSYALSALFYSHAEGDELSVSADYLKDSVKEDYWPAEERGKVSRERVTALALESLLVVGEGYEEEPLSSVVDWVVKRINETKDVQDIAVLSIPLAYIARGKAQRETSYRRVDSVVFRETKVEVGEQVMGNKIAGDYVNGDKVKEKLGDGATNIQDSVVMRSKIGKGKGGTNVKDSIVRRSEIGDDEDVNVCYDIFTGERVSSTPCYCPRCGTKVEEQHKFCPGCGFKMGTLRDMLEE